jgi:DNA-binding MarR family transcriptional regulator
MENRVQRLVGQWARERPDLDVATMATVARLLTVGQLAGASIERLAGAHGVTREEGDVLFSLRRAGAPYRLLPSQLSAALLVSSGTMTGRLDRLEARGMIRRVPSPTDRRSVLIELTPAAVAVVDRVITEHVAREAEFLAPLTDRDRATLDRLLDKLLAAHDAP